MRRRRRGRVALAGPLAAVAVLTRRRRRRGLARYLPHRRRRHRLIDLAQGAGTVLSAVAFAADLLDDARRIADRAGDQVGSADGKDPDADRADGGAPAGRSDDEPDEPDEPDDEPDIDEANEPDDEVDEADDEVDEADDEAPDESDAGG